MAPFASFINVVWTRFLQDTNSKTESYVQTNLRRGLCLFLSAVFWHRCRIPRGLLGLIWLFAKLFKLEYFYFCLYSSLQISQFKIRPKWETKTQISIGQLFFTFCYDISKIFLTFEKFSKICLQEIFWYPAYSSTK